MNKLFLSLYFIGISFIANCQGSEESKIFYQRAISEINPKHVRWIKTKAAEVDVSAQGIGKMQKEAQNYLDAAKLSNGAVDPNALVQLVLRDAYAQTTEDLKFYAEKVKYFNQCKKLIRDYLQKLRDYDSKMKESFSRSQYDSIKNFSSAIKPDMTPPSNPNLNRMIVKKDSSKLLTINRPIDHIEVNKSVSPYDVTMLIKELEQKNSLLDQKVQEASLRMQLLMERAQKAD